VHLIVRGSTYRKVRVSKRIYAPNGGALDSGGSMYRKVRVSKRISSPDGMRICALDSGVISVPDGWLGNLCTQWYSRESLWLHDGEIGGGGGYICP
jgi:hypothetical protein